jgi:ADP-heptose:LPS heptosyltransferase
MHAETRRYCGEHLGDSPRILILGTEKLGNFIVLQPTIKGLLKKFPDASIIYRGHWRTAELERSCRWIHQNIGCNSALPKGVDLLMNADLHNPLSAMQAQIARPKYAVGSVAGLSPGKHPLQRLSLDEKWWSDCLQKRYQGWITSNNIRELHARCCWLDFPVWLERGLPSKRPPRGTPKILISVNAERQAKLWPVQSWLELIDLIILHWGLKPNEIGLVGSREEKHSAMTLGRQSEKKLCEFGITDLRGRLSLPEVVGAFSQADVAICVDSGPLHIAAEAGCWTIAIFGTDSEGKGASPRKLWLPEQSNVIVVNSPYSCQGCQENLYKYNSCNIDGHPCMTSITPQQVFKSLPRHLRQLQT